jgi:hypothetical protein
MIIVIERFPEFLDYGSLPGFSLVMFPDFPVRIIIVISGNNHFGFRCTEFIQNFLVSDCRIP